MIASTRRRFAWGAAYRAFVTHGCFSGSIHAVAMIDVGSAHPNRHCRKPNKSRQINRRDVRCLGGFRRLGVWFLVHRFFVPESGGVCAGAFGRLFSGRTVGASLVEV